MYFLLLFVCPQLCPNNALFPDLFPLRQQQLQQLSEDTVRNELMNVKFQLQQETNKYTSLRYTLAPPSH